MKNGNNQEAVRRYFDEIAAGYSEKYRPGSTFHYYFFQERLSAATAGLDFEGKYILDIGAGTGALYDYLHRKSHRLEYYATDISTNMLAQSNIPQNRRYPGTLTDNTLPVAQFDYIFMLGVTTYMSRAELETHLNTIHSLLTTEGRAILSFTHRCSPDFHIRRLFRTLQLAKLAQPTQSRVIGQSFPTTAYCQKDLEFMLNSYGFYVHRVEWMNQTLTPFNHLLPGASVRLAKWMKRILPEEWLPVFSGDFLIMVRKGG